jgi:putative transposase
MARFLAGSHRRPSWRKAGCREGYRIVHVKSEHVRRLSRRFSLVWVPKVGWVRFRLSRSVPDSVKSYRITLDRAGRWHIAFAVKPESMPGPGTGEVVGIDRGVVVSAAISTGELLHAPRLSTRRRRRLALLQRKLARAERGSNRRARVKLDIARLTRSAKGTIEAPGRNVSATASLNREILASGWGLLVRRLEDKASGRVEKINPGYTSQRCSECGRTAAESRESQSRFRCVACGYACNADVNAARNIAAGHAVTARGGIRAAGPVNREPQHAGLQVASLESAVSVRVEDVN